MRICGCTLAILPDSPPSRLAVPSGPRTTRTTRPDAPSASLGAKADRRYADRRFDGEAAHVESVGERGTRPVAPYPRRSPRSCRRVLPPAGFAERLPAPAKIEPEVNGSVVVPRNTNQHFGFLKHPRQEPRRLDPVFDKEKPRTPRMHERHIERRRITEPNRQGYNAIPFAQERLVLEAQRHPGRSGHVGIYGSCIAPQREPPPIVGVWAAHRSYWRRESGSHGCSTLVRHGVSIDLYGPPIRRRRASAQNNEHRRNHPPTKSIHRSAPLHARRILPPIRLSRLYRPAPGAVGRTLPGRCGRPRHRPMSAVPLPRSAPRAVVGAMGVFPGSSANSSGAAPAFPGMVAHPGRSGAVGGGGSPLQISDHRSA